jgi:predicted metalloprotease with PDZ domain
MTVRYAIRAAQPAAHLFHVTVTVAEPDPDGQAFRLPAWIPGSYLVRDFARHIVRLTALAGGRKAAVRKTDKATWRCAPATGELTLAYEVYAWDLSVRAAHLDQTHGFFNGPSVFLAAVGREAQACRIDILPPAPRSTWRVATGLRRAPSTRAGSFGTYLADDYDELIDCPVEMGTFELGRFDVFGVPHEIALTGRIPRLDLSRLNADVARVCATHARMFEPRQPKLPFDRYTFLTMVVDDGYGGLEHRNSTALLCNRADLPHLGLGDSTEGYRRFLGLASHEYFHAWNVKRIRPAAFVPYDLERENYTRLLWIFEGFTSYYDDLALARAALLTEAQYLDTLATTLTTVTQRSGRLKQSLGDSSFDSWIKYYRQDENAPNAIVSYYQKGSLVAAALDLAIRAETRGRRSLDDLMRLMWSQFKRAGARYAGIGEEEIAALVEQAVGLKLGRVIREWSDGTRDPDFARLLAPFGIVCDKRPAVDPPHFALLGAQIRREGTDCRLAQVFDGGPAQAAGLSAGDALVALDGLRATAAGVDRLLSRYRPGDEIEALAFRRDELMRFSIRLATQPPARYALRLAPAQTEATRRLRRSWLGAR